MLTEAKKGVEIAMVVSGSAYVYFGRKREKVRLRPVPPYAVKPSSVKNVIRVFELYGFVLVLIRCPEVPSNQLTISSNFLILQGVYCIPPKQQSRHQRLGRIVEPWIFPAVENDQIIQNASSAPL